MHFCFDPLINTNMDYIAAKLYILRKLDRELSDQLYYHGKHHTLDVLEITEELCALEGVQGEDVILLKTAALYHDSGFTITSQSHEALGCEIAREALPAFAYNKHQIERICGMIMATKIPQSPKNHLEEILCDADLDYLGRADFDSIGKSLFDELQAQNIINHIEDWNRIQVKFLNAHFFHTKTNKERRGPVKQRYLKALEALVATY